ncbi:ABC transporter substrate-binding protein [Pseudogulbenkiania sp. MAI-1]|uniref:substrate-binding periplasmic protein n=1 Tax=Pseudogulbenkiania sp. MAI-1 TaxID=990370 RepID=UPI00045E8FC6|nr:transporter substrate-binding domain-containing protein [Pseudogulbenkiania sp. MAI-1]
MQGPKASKWVVNRCCQVLLAILLCCISLSSYSKTITLLSIEYPPYTGHSLKQEGLITAIAVAAFSRVGYQLNIQYRPWARALQEVKRGESAGVLDVWYSKERTAFLEFSQPLFVSEVGFYARSNKKIDVRDLSKLGKFTIGVVRGTLKPPNFEAARLRMEDGIDDASNLLKLAAGRVDLVMTDRRVGEYLLRHRLQPLRSQLVWLTPAIYQFPLYVGFSKRYPGWEKIVTDFNTGLALLQKDGTLEKIKSDKEY